ncbi:MAG TPA: EscU/YscU/HrcU family type III secretion system export apparatus switch protein [Acidimicrobiales bacterium]|nr:EscU/YscU/HrcU family type III secretion system export apparatus switch protein [Acidimicrobiales bacterium]
MPGQDRQSRTERPTARRKKEARHQGTVARTPEVVTWLTVLLGSYLVQHTFEAMYQVMTKAWATIGGAMANPGLRTDYSIAAETVTGAAVAIAPALVATMVSALLVNLAQTRGLVTLQPLKPNFTKLNPATGVKRILSPRSLWEVAKQLVRVGLLSLIVWQVLSGLLPLIAAHNPLSSFSVASIVASRALALTREVAAVGLVLSVADYIVQYRKVSAQLRMTREEVKEERKATEGHPVMRGNIRRRQRQISRNRMIQAIAKADAVVVNPTHFAVALRYVRGRGAPKVVAKGTDFLALRIKEEATARRVPVVEDPPLARALYVACDLEQEIPAELYEAVAKLLTFIYGLKAAGRATRIDGAPLKPTSPLLTRSLAPGIAGAASAGRADSGGDEGEDEEDLVAAPGARMRPLSGAGGAGGGGAVTKVGSLS